MQPKMRHFNFRSLFALLPLREFANTSSTKLDVNTVHLSRPSQSTTHRTSSGLQFPLLQSAVDPQELEEEASPPGWPLLRNLQPSTLRRP